MILSDKSLTRMMGEAYKGAGYQMLLDEEQLILTDAMWAVKCEKSKIPAEVLAMIVKHLGRIPEGEICYRVNKKGVQTIMAPMMRETIEAYENEMPIDGDAIKATPLSWKSATIWQREKDLSLLRMDPGLTSIVTGFAVLGAVCSKDGCRIGFHGECSEVFLLGMVEHEDDSKCMEYLGGMQWI